jgi:NADPH:quinone reductase-like Zn-dependent oxidoreductase
MSSRV